MKKFALIIAIALVAASAAMAGVRPVTAPDSRTDIETESPQ